MVPHQHTEQVLAPARGEPDKVEPGPYASGVAVAPRRPAPVEAEAPTAVVDGDTLIAGEGLRPGWSLTSASREFAASMRRDGNLVVHRCRDHTPLWQAGTGGNSGAFLEMRNDGDLCVMTLTGAKAWSTRTRGKPGAFVQLGDDGALVVYSFYRERVWSTGPT